MTHTYAELEVTPMSWHEIRRRVTAAGCEDLIHDGIIDMHGIGLKSLTGPRSDAVIIGTILSQRSKEGMIELAVNGERAPLDLSKAREVHRNLGGAIEAAISDQLIFRFLLDKVGLDDDRASRMLLEFREMRQGTRGVVYPT